MKLFNLFLVLFLLASPVILRAQQIEVLDASEQKQMLWRHNYWRNIASNDMPKLKWSNTLAMAAKILAKDMTAECSLQQTEIRFGKNIYISAGTSSPQAVVDSWAAGKKNYDEDLNQCTGGVDCKPYQQVVWSKTTAIGCVKVRCTGGDEVWICVYNPKGNTEGEKPY